MTNKLTDSEIKKALEICTTNGASCKDCPAFVKVDRSNCKKVLLGALDIINRRTTRLQKVEHQLDDALKMYHVIKAEAYTECIELVKSRKRIVDISTEYGHEVFAEAVTVEDMDGILNELVGGENEL